MPTIRKIKPEDKFIVINMMRTFYATPFVSTNGSEEIFEANLDACISESPYLEGYVFVKDGDIIGYGMLAKSFSTEFGKPCIWVEDLYIKDEYRGMGLGSSFFKFIEKLYPDCLFRLEVEAENERALNVYKKMGYEFLPYLEMKK